MKCENCGKSTVKIKKMTKSFGKGKDLIIIAEIPTMVCKNCGESYISAETAHEIDRIKAHRKSISEKKEFDFAEYELQNK